MLIVFNRDVLPPRAHRKSEQVTSRLGHVSKEPVVKSAEEVDCCTLSPLPVLTWLRRYHQVINWPLLIGETLNIVVSLTVRPS